jgi:hypothetical protein
MKTDLKDAFCEDINRVELFYSGVRQHLVLVLSNFAFCYLRCFIMLCVYCTRLVGSELADHQMKQSFCYTNKMMFFILLLSS